MGNPGYGAIGGEAPPPYVPNEPAEAAQRPDGRGVALPGEGGVPIYNLVQLDAGGPLDEPRYLNIEEV